MSKNTPERKDYIMDKLGRPVEECFFVDSPRFNIEAASLTPTRDKGIEIQA
jgi:hypothetical protein